MAWCLLKHRDNFIPLPLVVVVVVVVVGSGGSIFCLGRTYNVSIHPTYVKFVGHNLKVTHCHHVCNCRLANNIRTEFVYICKIRLHIKFHISSSNNSLVITIKPKKKYRIHAVAILFYILQKITLTKVARL
jgi:hypothetical protein